MISNKNNNRYEYSKIALKGLEGKYISIPLSLITDSEIDEKRVSVLSFLKIRSGIDDIVAFTIPDMIEWCGSKPDRRTGGLNGKYIDALDELVDKGYITYLNERSKSGYIKCEFNTSYYHEECLNGYASVYLDEIEKIMQYKKKNKKDTSITNVKILLVFAYLRHKIVRRPNELKPEERTTEGIEERKERYPEAFYAYIKDIADELRLSVKTIPKIIAILEEELGLIVTDSAYRIRNKDGKFRTLPTIFANAYKREKDCLLLTEEDYSRNEIEAKARKIRGYKINKDKRKVS